MLNCAKLTDWPWLNFATAPQFPVTHRRAGVQNESEHIASACTHSGWIRMRMEVMISPTFSRRSAKLRRMPIAGRRIRPGTLIPDGHTARAITHARTHAHADTHTHARTRTRTRARTHPAHYAAEAACVRRCARQAEHSAGRRFASHTATEAKAHGGAAKRGNAGGCGSARECACCSVTGWAAPGAGHRPSCE